MTLTQPYAGVSIPVLRRTISDALKGRSLPCQAERRVEQAAKTPRLCLLLRKHLHCPHLRDALR